MEDGAETAELPEQTGVKTSGAEVAVTTVVISETAAKPELLMADDWEADIGTEVSIGIGVRSG